MQEDRRETEVIESSAQVGDTTIQKQSVSSNTKTAGVVVIQRIVWFIVGAISVIIALRFLLLLLGANQSAGFTDFIYGLSGIFIAPFSGIFGTPAYGTSAFEISSILAIAVYLLIGWGITKLLTIGRPHQ